mgnify:CR=1 FL=1
MYSKDKDLLYAYMYGASPNWAKAEFWVGQSQSSESEALDAVWCNNCEKYVVVLVKDKCPTSGYDARLRSEEAEEDDTTILTLEKILKDIDRMRAGL